MGTFLFDDVVFGPVNSRRLGISLGVNLLPADCKVCNFNCVYCECGWTKKPIQSAVLPDFDKIKTALNEKLASLSMDNQPIDMITFAGNGEPTLHPYFDKIINHTLLLRDKYYPNSKVAVLSNSTRISNEKISQALGRIDYNILKLDSVVQETIEVINQPVKKIDVDQLLSDLKKFDNLMIQTLFLKGQFKDQPINNTTDDEVEKWLDALKTLNPKLVMIYTIQRDTPGEHIYPVKLSELHMIADKVKKIGLDVSVSG